MSLFHSSAFLSRFQKSPTKTILFCFCSSSPRSACVWCSSFHFSLSFLVLSSGDKTTTHTICFFLFVWIEPLNQISLFFSFLLDSHTRKQNVCSLPVCAFFFFSKTNKQTIHLQCSSSSSSNSMFFFASKVLISFVSPM